MPASRVAVGQGRGSRSLPGRLADRFVQFSDWVNVATIAVAGLILGAMLFIATWGVVARFILHSSLSWNEEGDSYLFIWLTFLGAAVAYKERGHPAVMLLVRRAPPILQRVFLVIAHLIVIALCVVLVIFGFQLIDAVGETSASSFDLPMMYPYLALPVGSAIMAVHALANMLQDIEHPSFEASITSGE